MKHYPLLRRRAGRALALGLLIIVASCTSRPQQSVMQDYKPPVSRAAVAARQPAPQPAVAKETPKPVVEKSAPASAPVVAAPAAPKVAIISTPAKPEAATPPPPPPPPLPTTRDVLGLVPEEVSQMLGQPGLIRREKPAEVWQYAGADCVLHVFLYNDDPSGTFRVDHLEATDLQGATASTDSCLAVMIK